MKKIEHIGIAVRDLETAEKLWTALLGHGPYKREEVPAEGVVTSFFDAGNVKIELLASLKPGGVIDRFVERRGEGIHHIAFASDDLQAEIKRLHEQDFRLVSPEPRPGADNKNVIFVHPASTAGVLVEFCQERNK